jgi:hypothetical protein
MNKIIDKKKLIEKSLEIDDEIKELKKYQKELFYQIHNYNDLVLTTELVPLLPKIFQDKIKIIRYDLDGEKDEENENRQIENHYIEFITGKSIAIDINMSKDNFDNKNVSINDVTCEIVMNKIFINDKIKKDFISILKNIGIPFTFTNFYKLLRTCEIVLSHKSAVFDDRIKIQYESYEQFVCRQNKINDV